MIIGLERGTVRLCEHSFEWKNIAADTIARLKNIFGAVAVDIQHIGSTAITSIKAKPIIDIAVGAESLDAVIDLKSELEKAGFVYRKFENEQGILFSCGDYSKPNGIVTHYIHVMLHDNTDWKNAVRFRDYCNAHLETAKEYEALKIQLSIQNPIDPGREQYIAGKHDFITKTLRKAQVWHFLGKTITVTIDRPIGVAHPKHPDIIYKLNYGYIEGEIAPDGEELDVYVLGEDKPLKYFTGRVIAIIHRENDIEDKLVAAPIGMNFSEKEIYDAVFFQEQFYKSTIQVL